MAGVSDLCLMLLAVGLAVAQRPGADVRDWARFTNHWIGCQFFFAAVIYVSDRVKDFLL